MAKQTIKFQDTYPLDQFTRDQQKLILSNTGAIELTAGCSIGCDFCGVDAEKKVKKSISFEGIEKLAIEFADKLKYSKPCLYWATEPLDFKDGDKDYFDVADVFVSQAEYRPWVSTRRKSK